MSTAIDGNHLKPVRAARVEFGIARRITAPHAGIAHPAVDEDDGLSFAFRDITNLHAVRVEHAILGMNRIHGRHGQDQERASQPVLHDDYASKRATYLPFS